MTGNAQRLSPPRARSRVLKAIVTAVILTVFFGAAEITLRNTHFLNARTSYVEPDSLLGWRFSANSKYWFRKPKENDHAITGRVNSYGWRDKEWTRSKSPDSYRIAMLGDSYVAAFHVEPESTFSALLERQWNGSGDRKIDVMTFARPGFTQTEEFLVLQKEITGFSPDMVVLFFFPGNDIKDVRRCTAGNPLRPYYHISEDGSLVLDTSFTQSEEFKGRSSVNWLMRHSALACMIIERYTAYERKRLIEGDAQAATDVTGVTGAWSLCTAHPDTSLVRSYRLNKALIRAMRDYCETEGFRFVLVTIAGNAYLPERELKFKSRDLTFDLNYFEDNMGHYAEQLDIEHIGLQRPFREAHEATGVVFTWFHWNYRGHELVASILTGELESIISSN